MRHLGMGRRNLFGGMVAAATALVMLTFAVPALANAPNPETTTVDQVVVNADGSRPSTVLGTWTWQTQSNCSTARNGVGYQIDWFDNQADAIGKANDPNGVLYVGDAQDNIVHSDESLGGVDGFGEPFWDGVPSSYLSHNASNTTPTQTDAKNWLGECDQVNSSGVTAGIGGRSRIRMRLVSRGRFSCARSCLTRMAGMTTVGRAGSTTSPLVRMRVPTTTTTTTAMRPISSQAGRAPARKSRFPR